MLQKNFFERRLLARDRAHGNEKVYFEISSTVGFYNRELKLVPKCRQMNKLSCGIT